ncbi:MAG: enoyl-CoA hydratase-related protein [Pseudomonadota bacterium]|nr:enoyl-CoA hydratase-related protein [Pseudomonadota bacterium]
MASSGPTGSVNEVIELSTSSTLATVTINRPSKLNALNFGMWEKISTIFMDLNNRSDIRCIILQGSGDVAFGPGADITEFETKRKNSEQAKEYGKVMHSAMESIRNCRHPVLAKINGLCVGGSLELALVCDIRVASENSKFGVPVNKLGLVMARSEAEALVRLVGTQFSLEILLEGRVFDAHEAKEKGLLNRLVPNNRLDSEVDKIASNICAGAPLVNQWHKKIIHRIMDTLREDVSKREDQVDDFSCFDTKDFREGVRTFLNKKDPVFKGK